MPSVLALARLMALVILMTVPTTGVELESVPPFKVSLFVPKARLLLAASVPALTTVTPA